MKPVAVVSAGRRGRQKKRREEGGRAQFDCCKPNHNRPLLPSAITTTMTDETRQHASFSLPRCSELPNFFRLPTATASSARLSLSPAFQNDPPWKPARWR